VKLITVFLLLVLFLSSPVFAGPIHEAAKTGDIAALKILADADRSLLQSQDEVGKTPLHWAVGKGQPAMVVFLLDNYKVDPNIRNKNGGTPLHVAASQAQPECAKILIAYGADVNARTQNDSTPLHFAAFKGGKPGHIAAVKILIEAGADVNAKTDTGATPLSMAMGRQNTDIAALLKEHGAKIGSVSRGAKRGGMSGKGNYYLDDY